VKYPVRRRLAPQDSLERIAVQIAEHDLEAAYRFVDAVEASLSLLSEMGRATRQRTLRLQDVFESGSFRGTAGICFSTSLKDIVHLIDVVDGKTDYDVEDLP